MKSLTSASRFQKRFLPTSVEMGNSIALPPEVAPFSGFIAVTPCLVKANFTKLLSRQISSELSSNLTFSWGSLSNGVVSTPGLATLLELALVLALTLALQRQVLARC